MLWWAAGCIFIDDAEHAAFLATLGGDDSGDTADTADTDTGDPGGGGFPSGRVEAVAAGFGSGEADAHLGTHVWAGVLADRGSSLVSSTRRSLGEDARAWSLDLAARGTVHVLTSPEVGTTPVGVTSVVQSLGAVPDGDGLRLGGAVLGSKLEAWSMRAAGEGSSLGTLGGEAPGDGFGDHFVALGERIAIGAPGGLCGSAYVVEWSPAGVGDEQEVYSRFQDGGRKLVPPASCGGDRCGERVAGGEFVSGVLGVAVAAPAAAVGGRGGGGQVWVFVDLDAAAHDDGVVYAETEAVRLDGESEGARFGASLAVLDLDDDGHDDLAVGSPTVDDGYDDSGQVYLYLDVAGLTSGPAPTDAHVVLRAEHEGALFGSSVAAVGRDLVVGAPGWNDSAGAVFWFGGEGLHSESALALAHRLDGAEGSELGANLAGSTELRGVLAGTPGVDSDGFDGAGVAWWWW